VRRHVVRAFGVVAIGRVVVRCEATEDCFEIPSDIGVGVLAKNQRGARVLQEHRADAFANSAFCDRASDLCRDLGRAAASSAEVQCFLDDHWLGEKVRERK